MSISSSDFIQARINIVEDIDSEWKYSLIGPHIGKDALEIGICYNIVCYYAYIDFPDKPSLDPFHGVNHEYECVNGYHRVSSKDIIPFLTRICIKGYAHASSIMFFMEKIQSWKKHAYQEVIQSLHKCPSEYVDYEGISKISISENDWKDLGRNRHRRGAYVYMLDLEGYPASPVREVSILEYMPIDYNNESVSYSIEISYSNPKVRKHVEKMMEMESIGIGDIKVWSLLHRLNLISRSVFSSWKGKR